MADEAWCGDNPTTEGPTTVGQAKRAFTLSHSTHFKLKVTQTHTGASTNAYQLTHKLGGVAPSTCEKITSYAARLLELKYAPRRVK